MNPDRYASLDPDTPFRLDHVLNFLTDFRPVGGDHRGTRHGCARLLATALTRDLRGTSRDTGPTAALATLGPHVLAQALSAQRPIRL
jgi:hypothetical protein